MNRNEIYCEENEGPFKEGETFQKNSYSFSIINPSEKKFIIFNFPKETTLSNFIVGYSIKSNYKEEKEFEIGYYINETLQKIDNKKINPDQMISEYYTVNLPENGLYKVKVALLPLTIEDRTYIEFWVNKIQVE
jgi:hypothetical protein